MVCLNPIPSGALWSVLSAAACVPGTLCSSPAAAVPLTAIACVLSN